MAGHTCPTPRSTSLSLQGDPANIGKGLEIQLKVLGSEHLDVSFSHVNISNVLANMGKPEEAGLSFRQWAVGQYQQGLGRMNSLGFEPWL
jgi:hypothetical protein